MNKLDDIKLELAKEYIQKGKITPALKLIKELIFEISYLNIKEQIELLNKLLDADINRKSYEYFFYRYIKPYINENERNSANALAREKNCSTPLKSQNKSNKSAVALNKSVKEVKNEKTTEIKTKNKNFDVEEYMNSNDGDNLFKKYNNF